MLQADIRKQFEEHGWVLIKNVFTETEIEQYREKVQATWENGNKGDILSNPLLQNLLLDDRIIDIFKAVLPGQPVYFGDGTTLFNNKDYGFHKDNPDRGDPEAPDWKGEYNLCRTGIYLQDHIRDSGGVLLRDKSFKTFSTKKGKPFNVPVKKGDVVVWNLRTTHSGNAKLLKLLPGIIINPKYYRLVPRFLFRTQKQKRMGIFLTIGREGKHFDRYIEYLKSRQYAVSFWQNSVYDPEMVKKVEAKGLQVIEMRPKVMDVDIDSLNKMHKDIPYQPAK